MRSKLNIMVEKVEKWAISLLPTEISTVLSQDAVLSSFDMESVRLFLILLLRRREHF